MLFKEMKFDTSNFDKKMARYKKESPEELKTALKKAGIQFLTWANNGSPRESRKPPLLKGFLRGSSSVFLGSELITVQEGYKDADAAKSHSDDEFNLTWVWNSSYAARLHETEWTPGAVSAQDGDTGNKWVEKHLDADREAIMKMVAIEFEKGTSRI